MASSRRRKNRHRFIFFNFADRNLRRTSFALSQVDRKLFKRRRPHYYGKRLRLNNFRKSNRKIYRNRFRLSKKFRIAESKTTRSTVCFAEEFSNLYKRRRYCRVFYRVSPLLKAPDYIHNFTRTEEGLFKRLRSKLTQLESRKNYEFLINRVCSDSYSHSSRLFFSNTGLLTFVAKKIKLLKSYAYVIEYLFMKNKKSSAYLVVFSSLMKGVFGCIAYLRSIVQKVSDNIKNTNKINSLFVNSNTKASNLLKSFLLKIEVFSGISLVYMDSEEAINIKNNSRRRLTFRKKLRQMRYRKRLLKFIKLGFI